MILCLETATDLCSVALCNNSGVVSLRESNESKSHATLLTVFIEEILKETGIRASALDAVAVSKGPGSYTGLRIGVSVAKGLAYSASIPVIAPVTTLSMFMASRTADLKVSRKKKIQSSAPCSMHAGWRSTMQCMIMREI